MILPKPGHGRRVFSELLMKGQGLAIAIDRQRRAAGRIDANADDLVRAKAAAPPFRLQQGFLES